MPLSPSVALRLFNTVCFIRCQILSVTDQVAKAVSMASLAAVCGLVEQEGISIQSENISALKSVNDYFYGPITSSQCQVSFGNINKHLIKPQLMDCPRLVEILLLLSTE